MDLTKTPIARRTVVQVGRNTHRVVEAQGINFLTGCGLLTSRTPFEADAPSCRTCGRKI